MSDINARIIRIMEHFELTPSIFADEIQALRPSISHVMTGRNKPGIELLQKVLQRFPEVSAEWLILGQGQMLKEPDKSVNNSKLEEGAGGMTEKLPLDYFIESEKKRREDVASPEESTKIQNPQSEYKALSITRKGEGKAKSSIRRITVYYSDNSFEDFLPEN